MPTTTGDLIPYNLPEISPSPSPSHPLTSSSSLSTLTSSSPNNNNNDSLLTTSQTTTCRTHPTPPYFTHLLTGTILTHCRRLALALTRSRQHREINPPEVDIMRYRSCEVMIQVEEGRPPAGGSSDGGGGGGGGITHLVAERLVGEMVGGVLDRCGSGILTYGGVGERRIVDGEEDKVVIWVMGRRAYGEGEGAIRED